MVVMKKREYLQLAYTYAPAWGFGGPTRLMFEYARWISLTPEYRVNVIAGDVFHDYSVVKEKKELLGCVDIIRVRVYFKGLIKKGFNFVSPEMFLLAFRKIYTSQNTVILHIAEFRSPVFLYAATLKYCFPKKVFLVHSAFGMLHFKKSNIRRFYDFFFLRYMLGAVDICLAQNEHEKYIYERLLSKYRLSIDKVKLYPLHTSVGNISEGFIGSEYKVNLRKKYDIPASDLVFIFLGRLHPSKGLLRVIKVFEKFINSGPISAKLLLVGRDDGYQSTIEDYIDKNNLKESIQIIGNVYENRFEYYALSDLFIAFPTIYEETMLSSIEALATGIPVLVSREADIPYINDFGGGIVIDFSEEEALDSIYKIFNDYDVYSLKSRQLSEKYFLEEAAKNSFVSILENLVQSVGIKSGV
jgi:glycosyltransferase involved in cell wall biosynthesis